MSSSFLYSPVFVGLCASLILIFVLAFVMWAHKARGFAPALITGALIVIPLTVVQCLMLCNGKSAPRATGGFETVADTVKPTDTPDASAESEDDKQLSELMKAILEE